MSSKTINIESLFAAINLELLTESVKVKGSVKHDQEVAEVMGECSEEYWPGCRMIVEEF